MYLEIHHTVKYIKHSEFVNNCQHKRKLLLKFMKDSKDELFLAIV